MKDMKSKFYVILSAVVMLTAACSQKSENAYTITGTAEGTQDGDTVFICEMQGYFNMIPTDTAIIKNGTFEFNGECEGAALRWLMPIHAGEPTTMAQFILEKGDIKAAQAAYDKFVAGAGAEVEEAGFQAGLYKMEAGNFREAIADFDVYKDNETYGAGAMYNIGICRMNLGEFATAVEAFVSCEEKGGTFEGLYYNRGVCRLLTEKWADAATDFAKSIETEPYRDDATYNLGICQMQQEDYETAEATFTQYIAENDKTPENGEQAEAGSETERIVNYGAYYYRAACRAALGKLEDAVADYTVCIEQQYELAQSYYQRAQVYAALGDTGKQNADLAESLKYAE